MITAHQQRTKLYTKRNHMAIIIIPDMVRPTVFRMDASKVIPTPIHPS